MRGLSLAGLLLAGITPAQPISLGQPFRTFAERLQSTCARTVAWAAYDIGRHGYASNKRRLVASLQAWSSRNDEDADVVRLHLLDALVQLDARLAATDLKPHLHGLTEVPAFILLARDPLQHERDLLDLFTAPKPPERLSTMVWWGAGNLLSHQKAPGFAAALLERLEFKLEIVTHRPGDRLGPWCGGAFCSGSGVEEHRRLPGFPPVPVYRFTDLATPVVGQAVERLPSSTAGPEERGQPACTAPGLQPVGWTRTSSTGQYQAGTSYHNYDAGLLRLWLQQLAGPELGQTCTRCTVLFTTEAAWIAGVQTARRDFAEHQRKLIATLVASKALTSEEAARQVQSTKFEIYDCRHDRGVPLPAVPDEPAVAGARSR